MVVLYVSYPRDVHGKLLRSIRQDPLVSSILYTFLEQESIPVVCVPPAFLVRARGCAQSPVCRLPPLLYAGTYPLVDADTLRPGCRPSLRPGCRPRHPWLLTT